MQHRTLISLIVLFLLPITHGPVEAQDGNFGVGFQIGSPTGFTARYDLPDGNAVDGAMAWHFDRSLVVQGHYLLSHRTLRTEAGTEFQYFMGPGAFIATRGTRDEFDIGASGNFGISYYYDVFEFFGQLTPQLAFIPATRFFLGVGIGARFYF